MMSSHKPAPIPFLAMVSVYPLFWVRFAVSGASAKIVRGLGSGPESRHRWRQRKKVAQACPIGVPSRVVSVLALRPTENHRRTKMPKYLFIQRSVPRTPQQKPQQPSPTQMQEMYAAFNAWKEKFKDNIVDMGGKLKGGGKVVTESGATDGPFVESKEVVGGDMLVSAENIEQAIGVAKESPGVISPGSSVEIREIQEMPGC